MMIKNYFQLDFLSLLIVTILRLKRICGDMELPLLHQS